MTYDFLQHYWCFLVSLLGALLVFLLFVQGANSMVRSLGYNEEGRRLIINSSSTPPASAVPTGCGWLSCSRLSCKPSAMSSRTS